MPNELFGALLDNLGPIDWSDGHVNLKIFVLLSYVERKAQIRAKSTTRGHCDVAKGVFVLKNVVIA